MSSCDFGFVETKRSLSSIAPTTRAILHGFANPKSFANPKGFADPIALGFAIAMINGFRCEFPQAGRESRVLA